MNSRPRPPLAVEFDQGQVPTIICVNKATADLGVEWGQLIKTLDQYVKTLFAPVWGTLANIEDGGTEDVPAGHWGMLFADDADAATALGYHNLTPDGFPLSKVFVRTTLNDGQKVSVTASHELAEMLVDPGIQMGAMGSDGQTWYAYETADAVERDEFPLNGIAMSNFVYPAWFEAFHAPGSVKFDHLGSCRRPFELRPGGYMPVFVNGQWTQIFGSHEAHEAFNHRNHPRMQARPDRLRRHRIEEAQLQLKRLGFYHGNIDGIDGPQTRKAVEKYRGEFMPEGRQPTPGLADLISWPGIHSNR